MIVYWLLQVIIWIAVAVYHTPTAASESAGLWELQVIIINVYSCWCLLMIIPLQIEPSLTALHMNQAPKPNRSQPSKPLQLSRVLHGKTPAAASDDVSSSCGKLMAIDDEFIVNNGL